MPAAPFHSQLRGVDVLPSQRLSLCLQNRRGQPVPVDEIVRKRINTITPKRRNIGTIPATLGHSWREPADKTKATVHGFRGHQGRGGHAMVPFQDREWRGIIDRD